jgi:CheY-like chemotaxis protein
LFLIRHPLSRLFDAAVLNPPAVYAFQFDEGKVGGNSLFVIDDEPAICALIQRIGEGCGYPVAVASDPILFKQQYQAVAPSVICLDLAMPGADGIEMLRFLAAQGCRARVLVISGYNSTMVQMAVRLGEALGLDMAGVVAKPIRLAELRSLLLQFDSRPETHQPAAA